MTKDNKNFETADNIYNTKFAEIRTKFTWFKPIYTDGSKTEDTYIADAAVKVDKSITESYNENIISIFTA